MTELQKCEFSLLEKAIKIINDNNLTYYLVCGSALGAVKYEGFIPWDDDIDIALPRNDYEKFIELVKENYSDDFALQNYRCAPNIPFFYSKIRNGKTTFIEKSVSTFDINHGVFIDVFPLDGYPETGFCSFCFELKKKVLWRMISSVFVRENKLKKLVFYPIKALITKHLYHFVSEYEKHISKFSTTNSRMLCNFGNSPFKLEYSPKEHYGEGKKIKFEGLDVIVPERYDDYLTQKYGDWRAELPDDQKKGHHHFVVCDLEHPYTDYIERVSKNKIRIKSMKA